MRNFVKNVPTTCPYTPPFSIQTCETGPTREASGGSSSPCSQHDTLRHPRPFELWFPRLFTRSSLILTYTLYKPSSNHQDCLTVRFTQSASLRRRDTATLVVRRHWEPPRGPAHGEGTTQKRENRCVKASPLISPSSNDGKNENPKSEEFLDSEVHNLGERVRF